MQTLVQNTPGYPVPLHLRNAPTAVHQQIGASREYQYPHDHPDGFVAGESYWPEELQPESIYRPVERGLEAKIRAKLDHLQKLNQNARVPRTQGQSIEPSADDKD
jgi:putative ATPase